MAVDKDGVWKFIPVEEYAPLLTSQMRFPSKKFYGYSGIPELDNADQHAKN